MKHWNFRIGNSSGWHSAQCNANLLGFVKHGVERWCNSQLRCGNQFVDSMPNGPSTAANSRIKGRKTLKPKLSWKMMQDGHFKFFARFGTNVFSFETCSEDCVMNFNLFGVKSLKASNSLWRTTVKWILFPCRCICRLPPRKRRKIPTEPARWIRWIRWIRIMRSDGVRYIPLNRRHQGLSVAIVAIRRLTWKLIRWPTATRSMASRERMVPHSIGWNNNMKITIPQNTVQGLHGFRQWRSLFGHSDSLRTDGIAWICLVSVYYTLSCGSSKDWCTIRSLVFCLGPECTNRCCGSRPCVWHRKRSQWFLATRSWMCSRPTLEQTLGRFYLDR